MNLTEKQYVEIVDFVHDFLLDYYKSGYTHPNKEINNGIEGELDIREYDIYKMTENLKNTQFNRDSLAFIEHNLLSRETYTKEEKVNKGHIGSRYMQLIVIKDSNYVLVLNGYRVSTKLYNRLATKLEDEGNEYLFKTDGLERY